MAKRRARKKNRSDDYLDIPEYLLTPPVVKYRVHLAFVAGCRLAWHSLFYVNELTVLLISDVPIPSAIRRVRIRFRA